MPDRLTDERTEVGQVGAALNTLLDHVETSLAPATAASSRSASSSPTPPTSCARRWPPSTATPSCPGVRRTTRRPLPAALAKVETETDRMSALVEDLLLLARLDAGRPLERAEVDLTRLLLESVADARVLAPDHRWQLDLPDEPVTVTGDEQRLHQVVTNLLGNARSHTPPGTTVTVSAADGRGRRHDRRSTTTAPACPPASSANAFERFTRGDSSRTRSSGGAGLGLSLVAAIAQAHGGTAAVAVTSREHDLHGQLPR